MTYRLIGAIIGLASAYFVFIGLRAIAADLQAAEGIAQFAQSYGSTIDPVHWLLHWHIWGAVTAFFALLGLVAGLALFFRKRWSLVLLATASVSAVLFHWLLAATTQLSYPFEKPHFVPALLLVVLALVSASLYRKWPASSSNESNA